MYCPLYYAIPGGILEVADTEGDFENACLREISEEIEVKLEPQKEMVAITSELHGTVGAVTIMVGTVADVVGVSEDIKGNKEWSDRRLSWFPVDRLNDFIPANSLEGLLFVKDEWETFQGSGESVLWYLKNH